MTPGRGQRALRALFGAMASSTAQLALAAPLLLVAVLVVVGRLPFDQAMQARSVQLWSGLLALSLVAGIALAAARRRAALTLLRAGLLLLLVQPLATWAWSWQGTVDAGVEEPAPPWRDRKAGPLAKPAVVQLASLDGDQGTPARLRIDGEEIALAPGTDLRHAGNTIAIRGPFPAPSFEVRRAAGALEGEGLIKIEPGAHEYFEVALLPHRFYLTLPASAHAADSEASSTRLHLRVHRNKIKVYEDDVEPHTPVTFEGLSFKYGQGSSWARIELRHVPRPWLAGAAVLLLVVAAVMAARGRLLRHRR